MTKAAFTIQFFRFIWWSPYVS